MKIDNNDHFPWKQINNILDMVFDNYFEAYNECLCPGGKNIVWLLLSWYTS